MVTPWKNLLLLQQQLTIHSSVNKSDENVKKKFYISRRRMCELQICFAPKRQIHIELPSWWVATLACPFSAAISPLSTPLSATSWHAHCHNDAHVHLNSNSNSYSYFNKKSRCQSSRAPPTPFPRFSLNFSLNALHSFYDNFSRVSCVLWSTTASGRIFALQFYNLIQATWSSASMKNEERKALSIWIYGKAFKHKFNFVALWRFRQARIQQLQAY